MSKILRIQDVINYTGLARATIYRLSKQGNFPPPVKIIPGPTARASGWNADDVDAWIKTRLQSAQ